MSGRALDAIIGKTPAIIALRDLVRRVAPARIPVLIEGPTGSGKELVAAAIHEESGRRGRFVPFNVCAIPESVFEAALFGHVRGAFTGAVADAHGYLREADHGTAFLDEIGALHPLLQPKLLRALETGEFRPVGARGDVRSDFRIVAAANERVKDLVAVNRLRADLAHRIAGVTIVVPPLAERIDDIPLLVHHFAELARVQVSLDRDTLAVLRDHSWPGNVRELRNLVECAVALGELSAPVVKGLLDYRENGRERILTERQTLRALLEEHAWNVKSVAQTLGIGRATVYRRMKDSGLTVPPAA